MVRLLEKSLWLQDNRMSLNLDKTTLHGRLARWHNRSACDLGQQRDAKIGELAEPLPSLQLRHTTNEQSPFRRFSYVKPHFRPLRRVASATLQALHLRHLASRPWKGSVAKAEFSGVDISGSIGYRNKGSNVLESPWASDHLYTHRNNRISVSILQTEWNLNAWNRAAPRQIEKIVWFLLH